MSGSFSDIVVLLPGIMGSTLSQHGKVVWAPTPGAAFSAVTSFGNSIKSLTVPDGLGDEAPEASGPGGGVVATGLFPDIHVIPGLWTAHLGYGKLERWIQDSLNLTRVSREGPPGNYLPFPYDWRLSIRYNGRVLAETLRRVVDRWRDRGGIYADAKLRFVTHSMGGLVARWAIEREGLAPATRQLVTLATPHRGSVMAVDRLVNGVRIGWGPAKLLDLTDFARSLPSLHHLLPEYAFLEQDGQLYNTAEVSLPHVTTERARDARELHEQLNASGRPNAYHLYPLVGSKQQTMTTGRLSRDRVILDPTIIEPDGTRNDEAGDGTVPRLSAIPPWLAPMDPIIWYATDKHGGVQSNRHVLDSLEAILTATEIVHRGESGAETHLDVRVADVCSMGAPIEVQAVVRDGEPLPLEALLVDEHNVVVDSLPMAPTGNGFRVTFDGQPEGLFAVRVQQQPGAEGSASAVTSPIAVYGASTL